MAGDVMTLRIRITDKEKAKWLWENHMLKDNSDSSGIRVGMLCWGDRVEELEYVQDRIDRFVSGFPDRDALMDEIDPDGTKYGSMFDDTELLEVLIDDWKKEADEKYGPKFGEKEKAEDDSSQAQPALRQHTD